MTELNAQNDEPRYTSVDMYEAWEAGFCWCAQGVDLEDGELFIPEDEPGVEGRDHAEMFGSWIEDYDTEHDIEKS